MSEFQGKKADKEHIEYFEKRVLNSLRGHLPSHGKVFFDTSSPGGLVAKKVIVPFSEKARNTEASRDNADLIVLGDSLDDMVLDIMEHAINGKSLGIAPKCVKPLETCSDKEIEAYARIKDIVLPEKKTGTKLRQAIKEELEMLEQRHPGIKYSILSSGKKLQELE